MYMSASQLRWRTCAWHQYIIIKFCNTGGSFSTRVKQQSLTRHHELYSLRTSASCHDTRRAGCGQVAKSSEYKKASRASQLHLRFTL
jgi:hypothetical protein